MIYAKESKRDAKRAKAIQKKYAATGETPKGRDKVHIQRINGEAIKRAMRDNGYDDNE